MALLRDQPSWEKFFSDAKIPKKDATAYAKIFVQNRITGDLLSDLTKDTLQELGITVLGDCLAIVRHSRNSVSSTITQSVQIKAPAAKLPQINQEMTLQQFRKFLIDWNVFKQITGITDNTQITAQLYSCCDDSVQNSLVNTIADISSVSEKDLLTAIESAVTKRSNPTVHRMNFASIMQDQHQTIQDYLISLKASAPDCEFTCPNCELTCPNCNHDLQPNHIRDQFIRGLNNDTLQTDILTKASQLKTLEDVVKHAEAFETALRDQQSLQGSSEVMSARLSRYKKEERKRPNFTKSCSGCGSNSHGQSDRSNHCPAWGTTCHNCNKLHHFARVCRQKKTSPSNINDNGSAHGLIAHVQQEATIKLPKQPNRSELINVTMAPCLPNHIKSDPIEQQVFPDSGASLCLANFKHTSRLNLSPSDLIPCSKKVTAVGGSTIHCTRWLPIEFTINGNSSKQPVFVCDSVDRIFLGRQACIDLHILPSCYPQPMPNTTKSEVLKVDLVLPERPSTLPYPATAENVDNLKQSLIDTFKNTAFNNTGPFPSMDTQPAHIHLKPDAIPHAHHVPIPVPFHWKEQVKMI